MKVLIVSDVHGHIEKLHTIVTRHPTVETVLSAGDQEISQSWLDQHNIQAVYGNAYQDSGQSTVHKEFNTWRVVMVHGHEHQVHRGDHGLARLMAETQADIVIHGHTHVLRLTQTEKGYLLNPGAVSHSRSAFPSSYVLADFTLKRVTLDFYNVHDGSLLMRKKMIR